MSSAFIQTITSFMIQRRNFCYTEKTKNHFTFKFC